MRLTTTLLLAASTSFLSVSTANANTDVTAPTQLAYGDFLHRVLTGHGEISYQRLEWGIASSGVTLAESEFDAEVTASTSYDSNQRRLPTGEEMSLFGAQTANLRTHKTDVIDAQLDLSKKVTSGATISLLTSLNRLTDPSQLSNWEGREHTTFAGIAITQPLLKGAGSETNLSGVHVAESDRKIAYFNYRKKVSETLREASAAYWALYLAQEKRKLRSKAVTVAQQMVDDLRQRLTLGKSSPTDVTEGELAIAERQALLYDAEQEWSAALQQVRSFLMISDLSMDRDLVAIDKLTIEKMKINIEGALTHAFENRSDYLAQRESAEKENLRLAFAQNQRYPQLDMKVTYGYNGLDKTPSQSWERLGEDQNTHWSLGFELKVPLDGKKSRSELATALIRKRQALELLKLAEVELANTVQNAAQRVEIRYRRLQTIQNFLKESSQLFETERHRVELGKSSIKEQLERENGYIRAQLEVTTAEVDYQRATTSFIAAQGRLLQHFGVEDEEEQYNLSAIEKYNEAVHKEMRNNQLLTPGKDSDISDSSHAPQEHVDTENSMESDTPEEKITTPVQDDQAAANEETTPWWEL